MLRKASSCSLVRFSKVCELGLWPRPAMATMSTKGDGGKPPLDAANHAEGDTLRDDMGKSYGDAYSTRCLDEGYGGRYGEAATEVELEKKQSTTELKKGASNKCDQNKDTHW